MDGKRIQCLSNPSQHVSIYFQSFPVIQPVSSKVRHFSTFFAHFGLPWIRPWDNRGKCYMSGKRIECWSNASLYIDLPIYLQPFPRYSDYIGGESWSEWAFYSVFTTFCFPLGTPLEVGTIAINVTRLERGFNACKTPRCIHPSIFNHFWDIASYWSKIAIFSYPIFLAPPQRVTPSEFRENVWCW